MDSNARILAGAMSGTSADGVDVAFFEISGRGLDMTARLLHHHAKAYDPDLRRRIFAVRGEGKIALAELAGLGREISLSYARAVKDALAEANMTAAELTAIAAHGQTLFHEPPNTIQWFDPALVAAEVGCAVVSDFRRADCAAGGQGAPLVPFADFILFRHAKKNRVLLNLGGIANLTYLPAGGSIDQVIAFDTGPGNCVLDHLAREGGLVEGFDVGGRLAGQGKAHFQTAFMSVRSSWFFKKPPKSTDGPAMIEAFNAASSERLNLEDNLATACLATALSICLGLDQLPMVPDELVVSGGGTRNSTLMHEITDAVRKHADSRGKELLVKTLDDCGIASEAKEALAFALLGAATLDGVPSNVLGATGARHTVVLGSVTPKPF